MTAAGPLAFVGGSEWHAGCSFDKTLLENSGAAEVLVLPTAAAYEHPERSVEAARAWFGEFGAPVTAAPILARPHAEDPSLAELVKAARFIYLSDGSPLHLRSVLKDSLVWRALVEAWLAGATIAGSSAGATVLGDPMVDPRGGTFTLGLGLIRNFAAVPHWEMWTGNRARRMSHLTPRGAVVAEIEEQTALIRWPDGRWESHGAGHVVLKRDGATISLDDVELIVDTIPVVA